MTNAITFLDQPLPPLHELKKYFALDQLDFLINKVNRGGARAGRPSGTYDPGTGFTFVSFKGVLYERHRIVWALANNKLPTGKVVHINALGAVDTPAHLRLAPHVGVDHGPGTPMMSAPKDAAIDTAIDTAVEGWTGLLPKIAACDDWQLSRRRGSAPWLWEFEIACTERRENGGCNHATATLYTKEAGTVLHVDWSHGQGHFYDQVPGSRLRIPLSTTPLDEALDLAFKHIAAYASKTAYIYVIC